MTSRVLRKNEISGLWGTALNIRKVPPVKDRVLGRGTAVDKSGGASRVHRKGKGGRVA